MAEILSMAVSHLMTVLSKKKGKYSEAVKY